MTTPTVRKPHGTDPGYNAHMRNRTPPCDQCRRAHTAAMRRYRRGLSEVQALELERLRPVPPPPDPLDSLFRQLIGLIAEVCREEGMLP